MKCDYCKQKFKKDEKRIKKYYEYKKRGVDDYGSTEYTAEDVVYLHEWCLKLMIEKSYKLNDLSRKERRKLQKLKDKEEFNMKVKKAKEEWIKQND